jgi:hypothetical protein
VLLWDLPGFLCEMDHQRNGNHNAFILYMDGTPLRGQGYRIDLENCNHCDVWTNIIKANGMTYPLF